MAARATYNPTTPQPHNPTTPQPHNPTTPQPHNPTTPQPHNPPGKSVKTRLKANVAKGELVLDDELTLTGVPAVAWDYKLGNRSALEWVLDQYKEKTPKDATIRERFNPYRFAAYRDETIQLLSKVCTVSVRTQEIVAELAALSPLKAKK
ncbi:type ISP restriction/modification enzyme [Hymenobacter fodinae]|uniref:type ISP restriction/modification enzyme n=1 Tax=Hymenobacter fodinae TaxID=2510796 RepID=UPI0037428B1C